MVPLKCPLCGDGVVVERIRCTGCHSAVEGRFELEWLAGLSPEQLRFVQVFLTARGKIKDVEEALGLSYPTVVSRLDDVVARIQAPTRPPTANASPKKHDERMSVLDELARGAITVEEAERRLKRKA